MDELMEVHVNELLITRQNVFDKVNEILVEYDIQNVMQFNEELDSFGFVELVVTIEDTFEILIEPVELVMEKFCNIEYITDYLYSKYTNSGVSNADGFVENTIDLPE